MDPKVKTEVACTDLISALSNEHGFELDDNFKDTNHRVAKAWREILSGYSENPNDILSKRFPADDYDQIIVVKDIKFYSVCAHHMLPFHGMASVGYLPGSPASYISAKDLETGRGLRRDFPGGEVVGLSKIARLVHCFAKRFQIQERMTQQIAKAIEDNLHPRGVGVVVHDSIHLCMHMRGVKESHATMDTSYLSGEFRDDAAVRSEFFKLIGR